MKNFVTMHLKRHFKVGSEMQKRQMNYRILVFFVNSQHCAILQIFYLSTSQLICVSYRKGKIEGPTITKTY